VSGDQRVLSSVARPDTEIGCAGTRRFHCSRVSGACTYVSRYALADRPPNPVTIRLDYDERPRKIGLRVGGQNSLKFPMDSILG
jgi:hypothetical protein